MLDAASLAAQRSQVVRTVMAVITTALLPLTTGGPQPSALRGELRIVGSRAMTSTIDDWTVLFRRRYPHIKVRAALIGDGVAAGALASRRADIAPLSRPLGDQERALIDDARQPVGIRVGASKSGDGKPPRWAYLYVARQSDGHTQPVALAYVRTALSAAGQARIAGGFIALSAEQRNASLGQLAGLGPNQQRNQ